jgi:hypothetical protein
VDADAAHRHCIEGGIRRAALKTDSTFQHKHRNANPGTGDGNERPGTEFL